MTGPELVIHLPTKSATRRLAKTLGPLLEPGDLLILGGPLGSGKTFFARALCRALGLPSRIRVPSPTFTLVQEYETQPPVSHADVYRLRDSLEVAALGLDSHRATGRIVLIEWGEPYLVELGGDALVVVFSFDPRRAALSATAEKSTKVLQKLGRCYNEASGSRRAQ
ncbi:MAG TPA: tRNA (adenosine(37)-N6)-threonylcarbamoyltransferase complex ATPase subunit type 1 TsaE [Polyangiaceae bacterium]